MSNSMPFLCVVKLSFCVVALQCNVVGRGGITLRTLYFRSYVTQFDWGEGGSNTHFYVEWHGVVLWFSHLVLFPTYVRYG